MALRRCLVLYYPVPDAELRAYSGCDLRTPGIPSVNRMLYRFYRGLRKFFPLATEQELRQDKQHGEGKISLALEVPLAGSLMVSVIAGKAQTEHCS